MSETIKSEYERYRENHKMYRITTVGVQTHKKDKVVGQQTQVQTTDKFTQTEDKQYRH